jgi:hypothetical protein
MKCKVEVKVVETPKKPEWNYPCFGRQNDVPAGKIFWFVDDGLSRDELCGMDLADGDCSRTWTKARFEPIPAEESVGWKVVIENGTVRLETGPTPAAKAKPAYPWLGLGGYDDDLQTLFLGPRGPGGQIRGAGWRHTGAEGSMLGEEEDVGVEEAGYKPVAGSVTITNRPGVEFPRLYAMCSMSKVAMRTAPDVWWDLRDGKICRFPPRDVDGGTDACRLHKDPVDTPLPDGSSVTLTFTEGPS